MVWCGFVADAQAVKLISERLARIGLRKTGLKERMFYIAIEMLR